MAEQPKKIRISPAARPVSADSAPDYLKQKKDGAPSSSPTDAERRSPVTDLLFDTSRAQVALQASDVDNSAADEERQRPIYYISIVAEMVETHPQTLRMYERMGLISPQRTTHNVRLYSEDDVEQVRRIQHLTQDLGVNLAGVEVVFKLLREMHQLREELEQEINSTLPNEDSRKDK